MLSGLISWLWMLVSTNEQIVTLSGHNEVEGSEGDSSCYETEKSRIVESKRKLSLR